MCARMVPETLAYSDGARKHDACPMDTADVFHPSHVSHVCVGMCTAPPHTLTHCGSPATIACPNASSFDMGDAVYVDAYVDVYKHG